MEKGVYWDQLDQRGDLAGVDYLYRLAGTVVGTEVLRLTLDYDFFAVFVDAWNPEMVKGVYWYQLDRRGDLAGVDYLYRVVVGTAVLPLTLDYDFCAVFVVS